MQLHHKLNELKEKSGFTNQKIADKSGVPLSTVTRILNGQTDNPNYRNIVDIVIALGGSLDDVEGIEHPEDKTPDKVIELYEKTIARQRKYICVLFFTLLGIMALIIGILIFDAANGNIGYFRY